MNFPIETPETDVSATAPPAAVEPEPIAPVAAYEPAAPEPVAVDSEAIDSEAIESKKVESPTPESATADAPGVPTAAPAPHADCGPLLKKTFPALFSGSPKPLKLRIQTDIQARAPGVFGKQALSAFFRRYTGSTSYLMAVSRAKQRFDLDGQPAGELSDEHRQIAVDELARRRGNQESRVALEAQQRRNRATLLHDFERTTLTPANFCALKGIGVEELDGYLATARREAAERPLPPPAFDGPRRPPGRGEGRPEGRPAPRRR